MPRKKNSGTGLTRLTIILAAIVSVLFGIVLWYGYWSLEQVFALLFFVGGIGKLLYAILMR
jgi:hypothetical protein